MVADNKRRGALIAIAVVLIGGMATAATILLTRNIARARRLQEIYVEIDLSVPPTVAAIVAEALEDRAMTLDEGSTVLVRTGSGEADRNASGDGSHFEVDENSPAESGNSESSQQNTERDVGITAVSASIPDTAGPRETVPEPSAYFAFDPYVLVVDQRFGDGIINAGLTLQSLADALASRVDDDTTPLVVAGDDRTEFAAFLLYLAGELISQESYRELLVSLQRGSDSANGSADIEELVVAFEPVVLELQQWRNRGILVFNWTDWDAIAVRQAILDGRAVAVFRRRSELFATGYSDAFFLRVQRLPVGEGKRSFRLWGSALEVVPGEGPRADASSHVIELLRSGPIQEAVERETGYSPVLMDGSPINRDHRDVVRWFQNAEDFIVIDEQIVAHPVFEQLHIRLR